MIMAWCLGAVIEHPHGDTERAPRGLVSLAPPSAVETAIQSLDGQVINSRHLKVRKAPEPKKRAPGQAKPGAQARRPARPEGDACDIAGCRVHGGLHAGSGRRAPCADRGAPLARRADEARPLLR